MKKIIAIAPIKDESDIIESFCRYNLTYCDGLLIRENGSFDNTREIIQNLINEGLPIHIIDDEQLAIYPLEARDALAHLAVDKYGADLIVRLDADEFLYHIDGINPRETLESFREDVEYQAIWRTYVYEREPDIALGFMPNNFTSYRNPIFDSPQWYKRRRKVIASKYLLKNKQAIFAGGAHFLIYPNENEDNYIDKKVEIHAKLVFAHFPVRGNLQVLKQSASWWLTAWRVKNRDSVKNFRHIYNLNPHGTAFNHIKKYGRIPPEIMRINSIEYHKIIDGHNLFVNFERLKREAGDVLTITGPMDVSFCADKLELRYSDYKDNVIDSLIRSIFEEIDCTVTYLALESEERYALAQDLLQQKAALAQQNAALTQTNTALTQQISEVYNSNTWKIGKRLQKIYKFIFRNKRETNG